MGQCAVEIRGGRSVVGGTEGEGKKTNMYERNARCAVCSQ